MKNNYFKFGDTFFHQLTGTAMGAPPACVYAILYYGVHEHYLLPKYSAVLPFYKRYIDDAFGIWLHHPDPATDSALFQQFQADMNRFGKLQWTFTPFARSTSFLDFTIFFDDTNRLQTKLYEKEMNLYLYLPPHSSHPPGIFKAFIKGMIFRILRLTTRFEDQQASLQQLFYRLIRRGYDSSWLRSFILNEIPAIQLRLAAAPVIKSLFEQYAETAAYTPRLFLHLTYHPQGPCRRRLQRLFRCIILHPADNNVPFAKLTNNKGKELEYNQLVVAYSCPANLHTLLFPRRFRSTPLISPSKILKDLSVANSNS